MNDFRQHFEEFCRGQKIDPGKLIGDALMTAEGAKLLQAFHQCADILDHTFHPDARFQSHHAGRLEILSLLWRYGTATNSVPDTKPNQQHASEEKRD